MDGELAGVSLAERCKWLHDAAVGMAHVPACGMVLDMRPESVLLDAGNTAKVCPLNLVQVLQKPMYPELDRLYMPKEYTAESNIYSFGISAWQLLTGRLPSIDGSDNVRLDDVNRVILADTSLLNTRNTNQVLQVLTACWKQPPSVSTASVAELLRTLL
jgi:serine/threonine protein kinase